MVDIWELRWFWDLWSEQNGKCSVCSKSLELPDVKYNETTEKLECLECYDLNKEKP